MLVNVTFTPISDEIDPGQNCIGNRLPVHNSGFYGKKATRITLISTKKYYNVIQELNKYLIVLL
jgi:hypothetical protein